MDIKASYGTMVTVLYTVCLPMSAVCSKSTLILRSGTQAFNRLYCTVQYSDPILSSASLKKTGSVLKMSVEFLFL